MSTPKSSFYLIIWLCIPIITLTVSQVSAVGKTDKIAVYPFKNLFYSICICAPIREAICISVGAVPERAVKIWTDEQM